MTTVRTLHAVQQYHKVRYAENLVNSRNKELRHTLQQLSEEELAEYVKHTLALDASDG